MTLFSRAQKNYPIALSTLVLLLSYSDSYCDDLLTRSHFYKYDAKTQSCIPRTLDHLLKKHSLKKSAVSSLPPEALSIYESTHLANEITPLVSPPSPSCSLRSTTESDQSISSLIPLLQSSNSFVDKKNLLYFNSDEMTPTMLDRKKQAERAEEDKKYRDTHRGKIVQHLKPLAKDLFIDGPYDAAIDGISERLSKHAAHGVTSSSNKLLNRSPSELARSKIHLDELKPLDSNRVRFLRLGEGVVKVAIGALGVAVGAVTGGIGSVPIQMALSLTDQVGDLGLTSLGYIMEGYVRNKPSKRMDLFADSNPHLAAGLHAPVSTDGHYSVGKKTLSRGAEIGLEFGTQEAAQVAVENIPSLAAAGIPFLGSALAISQGMRKIAQATLTGFESAHEVIYAQEKFFHEVVMGTIKKKKEKTSAYLRENTEMLKNGNHSDAEKTWLLHNIQKLCDANMELDRYGKQMDNAFQKRFKYLEDRIEFKKWYRGNKSLARLNVIEGAEDIKRKVENENKDLHNAYDDLVRAYKSLDGKEEIKEKVDLTALNSPALPKPKEKKALAVWEANRSIQEYQLLQDRLSSLSDKISSLILEKPEKDPEDSINTIYFTPDPEEGPTQTM